MAGICLISNGASAQTNECTEGTSASVEQIVDNAYASCCSRTGKKKRRRCFNTGIKKLKKTKGLISKALFNQSRSTITALTKANCELESVEIPTCDEEGSMTTDEVVNELTESACNLKYQDKRESRLKKLRRAANRAQSFLGEAYVETLADNLKTLINARSCGQGGEERQNSCGRVVNPRDGATVGNVYKLSDHSPHNPVFITHNGARSGKAITSNGQVLDRMTYTGLANPDGQGARHHYRFNVGCRSLPNNFLLQIGSTCYQINSPCSRID